MQDSKSDKEPEQEATKVVVVDNPPEDSSETAEKPSKEPVVAPAIANNDEAEIAPINEISWTASEYIHHNKGAGWFLSFGAILLIVVAGTYLLLHNIFSSVIIFVMGVTFGVFANRKPREITYQITNQGLLIGAKFYPYDDFKSFTVIDEGGISSLTLVPLKRFTPPISVYYEPKDEDNITKTLEEYLPHDDTFKDPYQSMMRKIKF